MTGVLDMIQTTFKPTFCASITIVLSDDVGKGAFHAPKVGDAGEKDKE